MKIGELQSAYKSADADHTQKNEAAAAAIAAEAESKNVLAVRAGAFAHGLQVVGAYVDESGPHPVIYTSSDGATIAVVQAVGPDADVPDETTPPADGTVA